MPPLRLRKKILKADLTNRLLPLLAVALFTFIRCVHSIFERVFKTFDNLNNTVQENIHGMRVVKAFVREKKEVEKLAGGDGSGRVQR